MSTLGATMLTQLDIARLSHNGKLIRIAEVLHEKNALLQDIPFREANDGTRNLTIQRTALPTIYSRRYNQGVAPSKSGYGQVTDGCAKLESRSEVDKDLAHVGGNPNGVRLRELAGHLEGMAKAVNEMFIYGDPDDGIDEMLGLIPRRASLGTYCISAGGSPSGADQSSIIGAVWGDSVYGIHSKGSVAGIYHQDLGEVECFDSSNRKFRGYSDLIKAEIGLAIEDNRQVVRLCNIDTSALGADITAQKLIDKLIEAYYAIHDPDAGNLVFYTNKTVLKFLHLYALSKASSQLTVETVAGKPVTSFLGHPIKRVDQMLATESVVT